MALCQDYEPPRPEAVPAAGKLGQARLEAVLDEYQTRGQLAPHDVTVGKQLARVLCGDSSESSATLSEEDLCRLERNAFLNLVQTPQTKARIEHTLQTGEPLRN